MLLPKDPNDDKNVIVEIRGGAGGDEAALFAADIYRMFTRYAERRRWKVEVIERNEIGVGGLKEIVFAINGQGAYSRLKFESGVHRVQRVPATESQGRVHTSTITVAVLPEVEDVEAVEINKNDLKIDTYRADWVWKNIPIHHKSQQFEPQRSEVLLFFCSFTGYDVTLTKFGIRKKV